MDTVHTVHARTARNTLAAAHILTAQTLYVPRTRCGTLPLCTANASSDMH